MDFTKQEQGGLYRKAQLLAGYLFFTVAAEQASLLYLFSAIPFDLAYIATSFVFIPLRMFWGGFMAARTTEATVTMNIKIVMVLAALHYLLITYFAFMNHSGWLNVYSL
ncbi:hypothetical protein [Microbulbifer sp. PAAF003]|uniref:hypothetical protein n=1 Tax=Microbulbifer sp. PAAF003 TaxID=3243375 RepID=UPI0040394085